MTADLNIFSESAFYGGKFYEKIHSQRKVEDSFNYMQNHNILFHILERANCGKSFCGKAFEKR